MEIIFISPTIHLTSSDPTATRRPAGNRFSHSANNAENDIYVHSSALQFSYVHHVDVVTTPIDYTISKVSTQACANPLDPIYFNENASCPSKIGGGLILLGGSLGSDSELNALNEGITYQQELLQTGDNFSNAELSSSNLNNSSTPLNSLLAASPYLSDDVLLTYLDSKPSADHISQVISANSPVSQPVWNKVMQLSIPNGVKKQLENLQVGMSPRSIAENELNYLQRTRDLLLNQLLTDYWMDTTGSIDTDWVFALIHTELKGVEKSKQLIRYYLHNLNYDAAQEELNLYTTAVGQDEYSLLTQNQLDVSRQYDFMKIINGDHEMINIMVEIAQNFDSPYSESMRAAVEIIQGEPHNRYSEAIVRTKSAMYNPNSETNTLTPSPDPVLIFPNPAANEFSVVIDWESSQLEEVQVSLFSLSGQLVYRAEGQSGHQLHTFDATDIQPGIYLIRVQVNGEDVTTQKLLIQK